MTIIYLILSHKYIHIYAIPVYTHHFPIDPQVVSSYKIVVLTLRARCHPTLSRKGALYILGTAYRPVTILVIQQPSYFPYSPPKLGVSILEFYHRIYQTMANNFYRCLLYRVRAKAKQNREKSVHGRTFRNDFEVVMKCPPRQFKHQLY